MCLRGRLLWELYDELEGICTGTIEFMGSGVLAGQPDGGTVYSRRAVAHGDGI